MMDAFNYNIWPTIRQHSFTSGSAKPRQVNLEVLIYGTSANEHKSEPIK